MKELPAGELPKKFVDMYKRWYPDATEREIFALHVGWGEGSRAMKIINEREIKNYGENNT